MSSAPIRQDWFPLSDILLCYLSVRLQTGSVRPPALGGRITLHGEYFLPYTGELKKRRGKYHSVQRLNLCMKRYMFSCYIAFNLAVIHVWVRETKVHLKGFDCFVEHLVFRTK